MLVHVIATSKGGFNTMTLFATVEEARAKIGKLRDAGFQVWGPAEHDAPVTDSMLPLMNVGHEDEFTIDLDAMAKAVACQNVERNLGNCIDAETPEDEVYEEVHTLAFDAIVDAGFDEDLARNVAMEVATGLTDND